ncbi:hypothetical protein R1flu_013380 [Riccia fluitans]|uniref:Uncharacterized protein n=1 Tax=Riccia fluitans TaxID=41844 RepID=A0ABD1YE87_9MARC
MSTCVPQARNICRPPHARTPNTPSPQRQLRSEEVDGSKRTEREVLCNEVEDSSTEEMTTPNPTASSPTCNIENYNVTTEDIGNVPEE